MIGVHEDMTALTYHAQTEFVSSTMLKRMIPELFGPEPKDQTALWFGSALHTTVLGGPSEPWEVGDFPTWQSKAAKEHADNAVARGAIPVLERDVATITAMNDALRCHSEASALIWGTGGRSEVSVFTDVDYPPAKARFDRLAQVTDTWVTAVDLKTTSEKPNPADLAKAIVRYGYDLSAAHYLQVAESAGVRVDELVLVFVCKEPPHYVTVVNLDHDFMERGAVLRDLALQRYLHPTMVESYPGESGRITVSPPGWARLD